jgi:hypothetical protein
MDCIAGGRNRYDKEGAVCSGANSLLVVWPYF